MSATRIAAIALIVAGILGLIYGGFSFTSDTHEASIGPVEISVEEKQNVNIPIWAGVGAIVVGAGLLVLGRKKG
jgi:LPXTG-motif cell wall-anchored protein